MNFTSRLIVISSSTSVRCEAEGRDRLFVLAELNYCEAAGRACFAKDVVHVIFNCLLGETKALGDLFICKAET